PVGGPSTSPSSRRPWSIPSGRSITSRPLGRPEAFPRASRRADLLFELLGLQTGPISQSQLVAAFHAWSQEKARPMAAELVSVRAQAGNNTNYALIFVDCLFCHPATIFPAMISPAFPYRGNDHRGCHHPGPYRRW